MYNTKIISSIMLAAFFLSGCIGHQSPAAVKLEDSVIPLADCDMVAVPVAGISYSQFLDMCGQEIEELRKPSGVWNGCYPSGSTGYVYNLKESDVNFDEKMIIAVYMGTCPSTCYATAISKVERDCEKITVTVDERLPCMEACATMLTPPMDAVLVEKSSLPVNFVYRQNDCVVPELTPIVWP